MALNEGQVLADKYRIERLLGEGGMGAVYVATNQVLQRRVALKVMNERFASVPAAVERFHREAIAASRVSHPGIVQVFDAGSHEGKPWIAMELLEGESLGDRLERGPMSLDEVLKMATGALSALAEVHEEGIIHRDLKPDNIFLARNRSGEWTPKVLDFGVAKDTSEGQLSKLTATGAVVGTAYYLSPEQAKGLPDIDARTDVYAMGVVLYECLSGDMPFEAETITQLIAKMFTEAPRPLAEVAPSVPKPIADVVDTCLQQERESRFQTARALLGALEAAAEAAKGGGASASTAAGAGTAPTAFAMDATAQGAPSLPGGASASGTGSRAALAHAGTAVAGGASAAASTPGTPTPGSPAPGAPQPNTSTPGTSAPGSSAPGTSAPGTATPAASTAGASTPGTATPGTAAPAASTAGASTPGTATPGTAAPAASTAGASTPGASTPGASSAGGASGPSGASAFDEGAARPATAVMQSGPPTAAPAAEKGGSRLGLFALLGALFLLGAGATVGVAYFALGEDDEAAEGAVAHADPPSSATSTAAAPADPSDAEQAAAGTAPPGTAPASASGGAEAPAGPGTGGDGPDVEAANVEAADAEAAGDGSEAGEGDVRARAARRRVLRRARRGQGAGDSGGSGGSDDGAEAPGDEPAEPGEPASGADGSDGSGEADPAEASASSSPTRPSAPTPRPRRPQNGLSTPQIMAAVQERMPYLQRRCYERRRRRVPGLSGIVTIAWTVRPDGRVEDARVVHNGSGDDWLGRCTRNVVRDTRFPAAANGRPTPARYPFRFGS